MKSLVLIAALFFSQNLLAQTGQKIDLFPFSKYLARPQFAQALLEANRSANGLKSRVTFVLDNRTRTTKEIFTVTVVGKTPDGELPMRWYQSEFTVTALNSGWSVKVSRVWTREISEQEFVGFDQ